MAYKTKATKRAAPESTENEAIFELDSKKQVTVRSYNGVSLVDIREFYIDMNSKEKKPGKKGISLTREVWLKLLENKDEISAALDNLDGKRRKPEPKEANPKEATLEEGTPKEADPKEAGLVKDEKSTEEKVAEEAGEEN